MAEVPFHSRIIRNFMGYKDRLETNLLQLFVHPQNSEWFSIISAIIFEVNVVAAQKQASLVTICLFFTSFHCPQLFYCPPWPTVLPASLVVQYWVCSSLMSAALPVCRGKLRNLRADCSTAGFYCVTRTWQRIITCSLCGFVAAYKCWTQVMQGDSEFWWWIATFSHIFCSLLCKKKPGNSLLVWDWTLVRFICMSVHREQVSKDKQGFIERVFDCFGGDLLRRLYRPVTSLGHQEERRVFWEGPKFFELCPIVSNHDQHIFPGGRRKIF